MWTLPAVPYIDRVVDAHFEELEFLLELRQARLFALDWTLADQAELEERIEAHGSGLREGGARALSWARSALAGTDPGPIAAAALLLHDRDELHAALDGEPQSLIGLGWGLRFAPLSAG